MASAGRILIMPKGEYDASVTYEMLDLVFYGGTSWIAKKTVVGIEPNETNTEYWHKLCESVDLTEIENRLKALEDEEIDLSGYFKRTGGSITGSTIIQRTFDDAVVSSELYPSNYKISDDYVSSMQHFRNGVSKGLFAFNEHGALIRDNVNNKVYNLFGEHNTDLLLTLLSNSLSGVKFATGTYMGTGDTNTKTLSFDFAPKVVIILGLAANGVNTTSTTILIPDTGAGNTTLYNGSMSMGVLAVTKSGNNVTMTDNIGTNSKTYYVCNSASFNYSYIAIG